MNTEADPATIVDPGAACEASCEFWVYGLPAPQGSKRALPLGGKAGGRTILVESSKKVAPWRKAVARAALEHAHWTMAPLAGPLRVELEFRMPRAKYMRARIGPDIATKYPDVDKLCRSTFDGIAQGGLIENDSQIVDVIASKRIADPGQPTGARIRISRAR